MDEQRRRDLILDDEVFLAGQGIFVHGVDPPLEPGGPIEVLAATDDPSRALSVLRERHGPDITLEVDFEAPYYVALHRLHSVDALAPDTLEVMLLINQSQQVVAIDVHEDATLIVLAAFVLSPIGMKLPGPQYISRQLSLRGPRGTRPIQDASAPDAPSLV